MLYDFQYHRKEISCDQEGEKENLDGQDEDIESMSVQDEETENLSVHDAEIENLDSQGEMNNLGVHDEERENSDAEDEGKENPESAIWDERDNAATNHQCNVMVTGESLPDSSHNQSSQHIILNGSHESDISDMGPENDHVTVRSNASGSSRQVSSANDTICPEDTFPSRGNVWPAVSRPYSFYDSTANAEFSAGGLPLAHAQINQDQQTHLIDLESDMHAGMRKDLLQRQPNDGSLNYPSQDRNELLQSLLKGQGITTYLHEEKSTGLNFHAPTNVLMANTGQFPGHFPQQLGPVSVEQEQKRLNDVFMQQNISENVFTDRGRYLIPRHENLQPGNMQNWAMNPVRLSEPLQSHLNGGDMLYQNWSSGEHQVRGGWTGSNGVSIPGQNMASVSNGDQSLFGVISNCSQLGSVNPYDSTGSSEQFITPRNYGLMAGVAPGINPTLPPQMVHHPLDYLGGRDAPASLMSDDINWMNLPHQNPSLQDPMGKPPYLRSWNQ